MYFVCIYFSGEKFLNKETFSRGHLSAKQALQNHIRKFHEEKKSFHLDIRNDLMLDEHKTSINQNGKSISNATNFKVHFKCKVCGKSSSEASNLKRHIHTVHEIV